MSTTEHTDTILTAALGGGASYSRAAEVAGIGKATVTRRMSDPGFRSHVEEMRTDHVRRVEIRLAQLAGSALDATEELLADQGAPAQRLGAVRLVLDNLIRYREAGEVEGRLAAIEKRLEAGAVARNIHMVVAA